MTRTKKTGKRPVILLPDSQAYLSSLHNLTESFYRANSLTFDLNTLFLYTNRRFTAGQFRRLQLCLVLSCQVVSPLFPETEVS